MKIVRLFIVVCLMAQIGWTADQNEEIVIERLPFYVEPASLGLFALTKEEQALLEQPPFLENYLAQFAGFNAFHARLFPSSSKPLPSGNLLQFTPPCREEIKQWNADIVGGDSRVLKNFHGNGQCPAELAWDGISQEGLKIRTGEPYTFIFTFETLDGEKHKHVAAPITLTAFAQQTSDGLVIRASQEDQDSLYSVFEALQPYAGLPLQVDVFANDVKQGEKKADEIVAFLADALLRHPDEIEVTLQIDPTEREEFRIHVLGGLQ